MAVPDRDEDFCNLMQEVCEGSEEAAWLLVERHGEAIRRAVRRALPTLLRSKFDSLDFVQIVWSSFFRVRSRAERFEHPEQLVAFLVQMALNKVGMETRRHFGSAKYNVKLERPLTEANKPEHSQTIGRTPSPLEVAVARERWDQWMRDQPEHYRQILHMKLQGQSCQEIASSLQLAESTVRRFLNKLSGEVLP